MIDLDARVQLGRKLRTMYRSLGMDRATCAKFLHVSERTLHNWESGRHEVPYAAYKLLRIHCGYVLPGADWRDWQFLAGALVTPEGHKLYPKDAAWWSLLARRAEIGELAIARLRQIESEQRATAAATDSDSRAAAALAGGEAGASLPGAAGGAAAPAAAGLVLFKTSRTRTPEQGEQCHQSDIILTSQCHQPSGSLPLSKPTPEAAASASGSASMPSSVWRWTHTCALQNPGGLTWHRPGSSRSPSLPLPWQSPASPASSGAGSKPNAGSPAPERLNGGAR